MLDHISKRLQKAKLHVENFRQKVVVRVWNLAKRLNPKQLKQQQKKDR